MPRDADNLAAIGSAGVARAYLWVGENEPPQALSGITIDKTAGRVRDVLRRHRGAKLSQRAAGMRTETGRRLVAQRHSATHALLTALERETRSALEDVS